MALAESFNYLAGKIISSDEFIVKLKASGFSLPEINTAQILEDPQYREEESLRRDIQTSVYLTSKAVAKIEEDVLQAKSRDGAFLSLQSALDQNAKSAYLNALPWVRLASWAYEDGNLVAAFIKAAEDCADHKDKVSGDLQEIHAALKGITSKISSKFGK